MGAHPCCMDALASRNVVGEASQRGVRSNPRRDGGKAGSDACTGASSGGRGVMTHPNNIDGPCPHVAPGGETCGYCKSQREEIARKLAAELDAKAAASPYHAPASASAFDAQVGGDHYRKLAIQPAEYAIRNDLGWAEGTAIAYLSRWRDKGGLEDLHKARHVIDMLIECHEGRGHGQAQAGGPRS